MLRRFIPVFTTNVNRYYSISSLHYNSTVPGKEFQNQLRSFNLSRTRSDTEISDHITTVSNRLRYGELRCMPKRQITAIYGRKCYKTINLHQNIYKLRLEKCSQIDFDCDEPLPLDWSDLPDAQVHHSDRLKDGIKLPEAVKKRRN
ncbi:unnamed protein product [Rotaria socialis]